jgi:CYTH domain-containing protein
VRYDVPWRGLMWEVDVFSGDNAGLVIAEVELTDERQHVELPPWVGAEVTSQRKYYNGDLAQRPYCNWPAASIGNVA